jgi:hypothetical protein
MKKRGCFKNGLRKIEAAAAIGRRLDPNRSSSPSFRCFIEAVHQAIAREATFALIV